MITTFELNLAACFRNRLRLQVNHLKDYTGRSDEQVTEQREAVFAAYDELTPTIVDTMARYWAIDDVELNNMILDDLILARMKLHGMREINPPTVEDTVDMVLKTITRFHKNWWYGNIDNNDFLKEFVAGVDSRVDRLQLLGPVEQLEPYFLAAHGVIHHQKYFQGLHDKAITPVMLGERLGTGLAEWEKETQDLGNVKPLPRIADLSTPPAV